MGSEVFVDRIYLAEDISERQMNNAIKKFSYDLGHETIVLLYDNSLFKDGKEGIIFSGTKFIYREVLSDPKHIFYEDIQDVQYEEDKIVKKNGKIETTERVVIILKGSKRSINLTSLLDCNYEALANLLLEIRDCNDDYQDTRQILTIEEMDIRVKLAYVKIIVNMAIDNDGVISVEEYSQILSLIARLNFSSEQRIILRAYMTLDASATNRPLDENLDLIQDIKDNCPIGNERLIFISLIKDLINIYKSVSNESISESKFISNIKTLLNLKDDEINIVEMAIENDRMILNEEVTDDTLKKNIEELVAKAGAVGVPIAAVYMTGSVAGLSAAGISSGLAALGLGGVLGFSSMVTGIGVAILIGVGVYKGTMHLTGSGEIQKSKRREFLLQEVLKQNQRTISILIEDINYISARIQDLVKDGEIHKVQIMKLSKALSLLTSVGSNLNDKGEFYEGSSLRTKCPKIINISRLQSLTNEPTKEQLYDRIMDCYEEKTITNKEKRAESKFVLKKDLSVQELSNVVDIFEAIGYFSITSITKNAIKGLSSKIQSK